MRDTALVPALRSRWRVHVSMIGNFSADLTGRLFDGLTAAYREKQRHYHTLDHLGALFGLLEDHGEDIAEAPRVAFAVWYHDVIYDPRATDNEEKSAERACAELADLGADPELAERVARLIRATKNHTAGGGDPDDNLFLDADLAIIGAPPADYDAYVRNVRAEYAHLNEAAWARGRGAFLSALAGQSRLFHTDAFEAAFARQARANIARERAALGATGG